ncbi:MAG: preprotein translocase subunit SecG [Acidimicrobiales bacterium]|nr:MAG: preprotein translocase subunit SecG [Acidimicrobiales bacterium]
MLTALILAIHLGVSFGLIVLILLHSGRGGGLSDMFGGSVGSAASGSTVVERNLDRITVAVAVIFAFTTVILALRLQ